MRTRIYYIISASAIERIRMAAKKKEDFVWVNGIKCTTAAPLVDISDIIPYERNARLHGSELEFLKNAIRNPDIGFRDPIEVDGDMIIVSGHGRRLAALELGMEKVPCLIHRDMHDDASNAYRLIANRTSELSGYDFDVLNMELSDLKELGWDMQQFSFEDMATFDDPAVEDVPAAPEDYIEVSDGPEAPQEDFKVMVHCGSAAEMKELFESLTSDGYRCQMLD